MTDEKVIQIEGFDKLLDALENAPETVMPLLKEAMTKSVRAVQARVAKYPSSSEANQPGRMDKNGHPIGYYERGRGWWYPIMQPWTVEGAGRLAGALEGKSKAVFGKSRGVLQHSEKKRLKTGVAGYKLRASGESEMHRTSWTIAVSADKGGVVGEIGSNTSYAPWLNLREKQASFHKGRGWVTVEQALEDSQPKIDEFFGEAVDEWMKTAFKG